MNSRVVLAFACGVYAAYAYSPPAANNDDSLALLLLASNPGGTHKSSIAPVKSLAVKNSKLMDRRQSNQLLALVAAGLASPALAGLRETYVAEFANYGTNINLGREYWSIQLPRLIEKSEWATLEKDMLGPKKGSKESRVGGIMFQVRRSMGNYITTQEKQYSPVAVEGRGYIAEIKEACEMILVAATGEVTEDGFLFFKSSKKLDLPARKQMANDAYKKGLEAYKNYITLSNSRALIQKIDQIED
jgi:hypothetical protein